jgi:hypothetical protein
MRALAEAAKSGDIERFKGAPHSAPMRRLDETLAARKPRLRWTPPPTVAPAPMAAKRAPEQEAVAPVAAPQERMTSQAMARQAPSADMAEAPMASGAALAPMAELVIQSEPREALLRLLELRKAGEQEQAQRLLEQLKADYPHLDIEAELAHLATESPRE